MEFTQCLQIFDENRDSVIRLLNFDKEVQQFAIKEVELLHDSLKKKQKIDNPHINGERALDQLRSIRNSPVLKARYETIYNQGVVLMVSYFGSAIGDVFRQASAIAFRNRSSRVMDAELKLSVSEIFASRDAGEGFIGDLLMQKDGISFQDMQSTHRAFKQFFSVEIQIDDVIRNIIVGQACRHAIVHDGATANVRTIKQIKNITPRTLKPNITVGEKIEFSIEEVVSLAKDMREYLTALVSKVEQALQVS